MLVEFKVRNFRSFRDEQRLSLVATRDRELAASHCIDTGIRAAPRLTRAAVIYGANASGKSNLIFALVVLRQMVLQSTKMSDVVRAEYTPFRLDARTAVEPTELEVTVLIDGSSRDSSSRHCQVAYDQQPWLDAMDRVAILDEHPQFRAWLKQGLVGGYGVGEREPWTRFAGQGYY